MVSAAALLAAGDSREGVRPVELKSRVGYDTALMSTLSSAIGIIVDSTSGYRPSAFHPIVLRGFREFRLSFDERDYFCQKHLPFVYWHTMKNQAD